MYLQKTRLYNYVEFCTDEGLTYYIAERNLPTITSRIKVKIFFQQNMYVDRYLRFKFSQKHIFFSTKYYSFFVSQLLESILLATETR